MGRTYAAATVALPSLSLTAVQAAAAAAVSSGVQRLEAAAVVSDSAALDAESAAVLADLGVGTVISADPSGAVRESCPRPSDPGSRVSSVGPTPASRR